MNVLRSPYAAIAAATWLAVPTAMLLAAGGHEPRPGFLTGWGIAGIAGLTSFGFLARAVSSSRSAAGTGGSFVRFMKALVLGFAVRLALVAAGLTLALQHHQDPIWFCVGFFTCFWMSLACEALAYRWTLQRSPQAEALP